MKAIVERVSARSRDRRTTSTAAALAALVLGLPQWAAAQEMAEQETEGALEPTPPPGAGVSEEQDEVGGVGGVGEVGGIGGALAAGGGVSDFSRSSAREFVETGGSWELRGMFGTRSWVGLEAAYIGAAYGVDVPGDSAMLVSNGMELSGRLNLLRNGMRERRAGLQPYTLAGVAWKNYQLSGDLVTADVGDEDNAFEIPVGAGLAYYFQNGMILDGRFAYRFSFEDELIQPVGEDEASLDNWSATARLGVEF